MTTMPMFDFTPRVKPKPCKEIPQYATRDVDGIELIRYGEEWCAQAVYYCGTPDRPVAAIRMVDGTLKDLPVTQRNKLRMPSGRYVRLYH